MPDRLMQLPDKPEPLKGGGVYDCKFRFFDPQEAMYWVHDCYGFVDRQAIFTYWSTKDPALLFW